MTRKLVIGTRGSELALWQANFVRSELESVFPAVEFEIRVIATTGDQLMDIALSKIGDKGLFTNQIERELLDGGIDLAVHSLKDLQTRQPDNLKIAAVCSREMPNDAFISSKYASIDELPEGAKIATGSLRRKSQLLHYRPDLDVVEIRGNVPTRLQKMDDAQLDGLILAYAGVRRLGLDSMIRQIVPLEVMVPAVGQGAVAVECRSGDDSVVEIAAAINDEETNLCVSAERTLLRRLEGGCQVPIGAIGTIEDRQLRLEGFAGSLDGKINIRETLSGSISDAEEVGNRLADILIERGAGSLVLDARSANELAAETVL